MAYNLNDYATVAERINQAQSLISTVITEPPAMLTDTMGFIRATVGLNDGRSATGTASFRLDLQGRSAQATNPIEDCETSAVGRALAMLGFSSSKSIASREEVVEAQRRSEAPQRASYAPPAQTNGNAPKCDICGTTGRLGKDGKSYFCPNKSGHGDKWYTIKVPQSDDLSDEWDAIEQSAAERKARTES